MPDSQHLWMHAIGTDWLAAYRFHADAHGQPVIAELRVVPRPPGYQIAGARSGLSEEVFQQHDILEILDRKNDPAPKGGVTGSLLREIRIGQVEASMREILGLVPAHTAGFFGYDRDAAKEPRHPGRRGHPLRYYAEYCACYVEKVNAGSKKPILDVAEEFGDTPSHVSNIIRRSRQPKLALLTQEPARPGKAGGQLTQKALDALRA